MPEADLETLVAFFKAMSNQSRLRIVGLLAAREHSVRELAKLLDLKEPTVCHHLAALKSLGLVVARADGVTRWHALRLERLTALNRSLLDQGEVRRLADTPGPRPPRRPETEEARVLASFVDAGGRLATLPASQRKRAVVLKWLARQFEEGRRYPEREVNEVLKARHWDSATLRRELIAWRMLAREAGVYWRLPESDWRPAP